MNTWGSKLKISIFGESHGEGIGVVLDGIPSGLALDMNFIRNKFRVRGDVVEIFPASTRDYAIRVEFFGDEIDRVSKINTVTGDVIERLSYTAIFPATHYAVSDEKREAALAEIEREMLERAEWFRSQNKLIEAQRITERTRFDLEMLREIGTCSGVENYSRVLSGRP